MKAEAQKLARWAEHLREAEPERPSVSPARRRLSLVLEEQVSRPATRGDCAGQERPCPFVSCKHHLYLEVDPRSGAIALNFPDLEVWEMEDSCVLDVATQGAPPGSDVGPEKTLEEVSHALNVTRERIRQIEVKALRHARKKDTGALALHAHEEGFGWVSKRANDARGEDDEDEEDDEIAEE